MLSSVLALGGLRHQGAETACLSLPFGACLSQIPAFLMKAVEAEGAPQRAGMSDQTGENPGK